MSHFLCVMLNVIMPNVVMLSVEVPVLITLVKMLKAKALSKSPNGPLPSIPFASSIFNKSNRSGDIKNNSWAHLIKTIGTVS